VNFEDATRKQLLQIALHEECDIDYKWQAVAELEYRKWHDDMLPTLLKLWGAGLSAFDIAIELDLPESTIKGKLQQYGLFGRRVTNEKTVC